MPIVAEPLKIVSEIALHVYILIEVLILYNLSFLFKKQSMTTHEKLASFNFFELNLTYLPLFFITRASFVRRKQAFASGQPIEMPQEQVH